MSWRVDAIAPAATKSTNVASQARVHEVLTGLTLAGPSDPAKVAKMRLLGLVMATALLATGCSSGEPTATRDFDQLESVVRVTALGCGAPALGSGFAVDEHLIITSGHLVTGRTPDSLGVVRPDGSEAPAVLVGFNLDFDLAALRVDEESFQPVTLLDQQEGDGMAVAVRGADEVEEIPFLIDAPVFVNWDGVFRDTESRFHGLRLDAEIKRGDSGSGLFVSAQEVVGLVHSTNRAGLPRAYAVSSKQILEWLETVDAASEVVARRCA